MSGEVTFEMSGYDELMSTFRVARIRTEPEFERLVHRTGFTLETRIKANASGRPGPNAPTGDYRRSWTTQTEDDPEHGFTAIVGTNRPQGPRLELGFTGVDSLGRHYDQPPYTHVAPAYEQTAPEFVEATDRLVEELLA